MVSSKKIIEDLKALSSYEVVLFGSFAKNESTLKSDIDVAVITKIKDKKKNKRIWYRLLGKIHHKYDIKVFEILPLPIQIEIINNYRVVFGNPLSISEYFYHFRKLWKDVEKRYKENQFSSIKEKKEALQRTKASLKS